MGHFASCAAAIDWCGKMTRMVLEDFYIIRLDFLAAKPFWWLNMKS
jgi:hypothetical protein